MLSADQFSEPISFKESEWDDGIGPDTLGASFGDIPISSHFPCLFFFSFEMVNWGWLGLAGGQLEV